ncbi:helix-turn-helix transcriptional regulator [Flavobacterium sp. NKUCC04_CG]|uniref:helix-turn-helix transcriptional regulator n=1 Tax=Flavobacterium sp. NKUCC04_CG TaxID=2842121 RepID=UPI001C5A8182|nr:helix-turn-helix transcriptional regulator [Flavobacterium sp. NKUCC04_CG]MBW3519695.1 helix-turn-helix domain-containing protein [Flavobacterium sp. NKUCC04_CG]
MDNFVNRLEFLLQHYEFSASTFADKIGVQRSSLSHLLSGRNKPSLDFIMKIYEAFPELNLYWLLKGEGDFLPENSPAPPLNSPSLFSEEFQKTAITSQVAPPKSTPEITEESVLTTPTEVVQSEPKPTLVTPEISNEVLPKTIQKKICSTREIEQIVIFYKDGSYSGYTPNSSESGS